MQKLKFEIDWVDAEGIHGSELSATWAYLRIVAGDSIVTRVLDARAKTVREFVYVPLYPLAEWLATNWWFLTREVSNPAKEYDRGFRRRHVLSGGREGYAFPDLEIVSSGGWTHLAWKGGPCPWTRVEFLGQGGTRIDSGEFRGACSGIVDQVIRRLVSLGIEETFLQREWDAIQKTDREEAEFCAVAAGLGWDPYALNDDRRALVLELAERLSGVVLEEAVAALESGTLLEGCSAITGAIFEARSNGLSLARLGSIHYGTSSILALEVVPPWEAGYGMARQLREALELDGAPLLGMSELAGVIGEDSELLERVTKPVDLRGAPLVDGVVTLDEERNPAFGFRQLGERSRRFHFCRALAEVLASPGTDTLLTRANSQRQQRNRAFAAEFLAPASGLQGRIPGRTVDGDAIDELADEFGVSSRVIEYQIQNHRIARALPHRFGDPEAGLLMNYLAVRELKKTSELWERLASEREPVITRDGRPAALMVRVTPETVEESLREIRRARFSGAVSRVRRRAEKQGIPGDSTIAAEIDRSRSEGE